MFTPTRRAALCALGGIAASPLVARAQPAYPTQTVTIVVPTAAGGVTDIVGRLLATELGALWKQPVIVDNRAGASGIIGSTQVARAPKDGYTACLTFTSLYTSLLQNPSPEPGQVDLLRDLTPVSEVVVSSTLLTVSADFPANTLEEFVAEVKSHPGKYAYGSYGPGSTSNIYGELIRKQAGLDLVHVPYKGSGPLTTDLLAGTVQIAFLDIGSSLQQVRAGKFKLLAVNGRKRLGQFPAVPTFVEKGFEGLETNAWMAMLMPTGTPRARIDTMSQAIAQVLRIPRIRERILDMNLEPLGSTPEHFAQVLKDDIRIWSKAIELAGVRTAAR